jgi:hypothetical protein
MKDTDVSLYINKKLSLKKRRKKGGKKAGTSDSKEARSIGNFLNVWQLGGERLAANDTKLSSNESDSV